MSGAMGLWKGLTDRKRMVVTLAAVLGVALVGYQGFYLPQTAKITKIRMQWKALRVQVDSARAALPDLQKEREQVDRQKAEIKKLRQEVDAVGAQLITIGQLNTLLGELMNRGEGLQMTLDSIKQTLNEDTEGPEVQVEMGLRASFEDVVSYLRRMERLSPFLRVIRLVVSEPKGGGSAHQDVQLVLATPLRNSLEVGGSQLFLGDSAQKVTLARGVFVSQGRKSDREKKRSLKVTGIAWQQEFSTAIVNEEVVRVGDKVSNLTVQQILPDRVLLSDGAESYTVELAR